MARILGDRRGKCNQSGRFRAMTSTGTITIERAPVCASIGITYRGIYFASG
jgi:hypothetical protein